MVVMVMEKLLLMMDVIGNDFMSVYVKVMMSVIKYVVGVVSMKLNASKYVNNLRRWWNEMVWC